MRLSRFSGSWATLLIAVLAVGFSGCGIEAQQEKVEAQIKAAEVMLDVNHVFVTTGDVPQAYNVLGKLEYTEPVSADSIDEATINAKLRKMALDRYPDDVDGIIHMKSEVSDDATMVTVGGEMVKIRNGPGVVCCPSCPLCRHKMEKGAVAEAEEGNPDDREVNAPTLQLGDLWIERINGQDTKAVIVSASQGTVILDLGGKKSTLDSDDNLVSGYSILAGREVSYTPDLGTLSFPLKKGKSWTNHWTWKAGDYSGEGTTYGKAVAWETVTVPAGTFSALRVDVSYRSVVPTDSTCWYAPEVNGFVKCDISTRAQEKMTLELVSYQPAQNTAER